MNSFHRNDQIVSLSRAPNPAMAHIWENALQQEGIDCRVVGDFLDAGIGDISGVQPEIWIRRQDVTQAQAVLGHVQSLDPAPSVYSRDFEEEQAVAPGPTAMIPTAPLTKQTAVAFDLGPGSLNSLHAALPGWNIEALAGATETSLTNKWDPGEVELLVVEARPETTATLALCRFLTRCAVVSRYSQKAEIDSLGPRGSLQTQAQRAHAPLLVLVHAGQDGLVKSALQAGAHSCLMLPIDAKDVASMLIHARAGNQPGRHTQSLEGAQSEDRWRDDGGQG
jgi:hypothetical protein